MKTMNQCRNISQKPEEKLNLTGNRPRRPSMEKKISAFDEHSVVKESPDYVALCQRIIDLNLDSWHNDFEEKFIRITSNWKRILTYDMATSHSYEAVTFNAIHSIT